MSESTSRTLRITRNKKGEIDTVVEEIYSPDDGGYYLTFMDFAKRSQKTSREVFANQDDASRSFFANLVEWE